MSLLLKDLVRAPSYFSKITLPSILEVIMPQFQQHIFKGGIQKIMGIPTPFRKHILDYSYKVNARLYFFKASRGPMLSISQNVCLSVRLSACVFTFEVLFKRLCAPTSQSQMSNIFEIQNPWGKVM